MDTTETGSDAEQEDVEKGSRSCPQPRVSLQLPRGELEAWSSGGGSMVIKLEIEPLRPSLPGCPGSEEVVSVRGLRVCWQRARWVCRRHRRHRTPVVISLAAARREQALPVPTDTPLSLFLNCLTSFSTETLGQSWWQDAFFGSQSNPVL